jgi:hypothetical protein
MADQIGPGRVQPRRIQRTGGPKAKRGTGVRGKSVRAYGLKQVDTIPRLDPRDEGDGESRGLARLLGEDGEEGFTSGSFADDLQRTLDFVEALPKEGAPGQPGELYLECARILQEEVARARQIAALRKAAPRA